MYQAVIVIHILVALGIVGLVLLQKGRGAEAGAGFGGGGGSGSLFGARGSATFLSRTTSIFAATFFTTSLLLAYLGSTQSRQEDPMEATPAAQQSSPDLPPMQQAPTTTPAVALPPAVPAAPAVTAPVAPPAPVAAAAAPVAPATPETPARDAKPQPAKDKPTAAKPKAPAKAQPKASKKIPEPKAGKN